MKPCLFVNKTSTLANFCETRGKIVKSLQPSQTQNIQCQNQRYETSIELQLLAKYLPNLNQQQQEEVQQQNQSISCGKLQEKYDQSSCFQIPLSESKINIAESTYKIETSDEIGQNKCSCHCFYRFSQKISKLKQQIQFIYIDYKIMKQNIKLDIKSCFTLMEESIIKLSNYPALSSLDGQGEISFFSMDKFSNKKNVKQKKNYLETQMNKNKKIIQYHEQILQKVNKQYMLFKTHFDNLNLTLRLKTEKQEDSQKVQTQRIKRDYEQEFGDKLAEDQLWKSSKIQKQQHKEIQNIKVKIQQLKNKLARSSSKYY